LQETFATLADRLALYFALQWIGAPDAFDIAER
jgi:hypothetical protein